MNETNTRGAHTPGPWTISSGKEYKIQGEGEQIVFLIGDDRRLIPNLDDARLIAAAPELLAALEGLLEQVDALRWIGEIKRDAESTQSKVARAAIAKARGAV